MNTRPLIVVGGGPAGIAAATEAATLGLNVTILDEAPTLGGQIYRQFPGPFRVTDKAALEKEFERGASLRAELSGVSSRVEVLSETSVLGIWNGRELRWSRNGVTGTLEASQMIISTGARERSIPFPGWTLPGVMTAGGAQIFVKTYRVRPGNKALVAGTGPLLLVVSNQLRKAGVEVTAVLEAAKPRFSLDRLTKVWGEWGLLNDAWTYWRGLRSAGIPYLVGHTVFEAHGTDRVQAVTFGKVDEEHWRPDRTTAKRVDVDLLVVGFGLVPNAELTSLAGCRHEYVNKLGGWVPTRDEHMRTSVPGVFAVGDGAGVAGALVALEEGRIAGITAAEQAAVISVKQANQRRAAHLRRLASLQRVRGVLDEVSRVRVGLSELARPDTIVCRCEEVRLSTVQAAIEQGARTLQAVKLFSRLGMGACQGRTCEPAMRAHLCHTLGRTVEELERIYPQPPVKQVTLGELVRSGGQLGVQS